ncbi:HET-domain-containing protein [Hypoxylon crocopeplum]|nr:HET-domain-containing protein [Hypoxylon crocopeplum]
MSAKQPRYQYKIISDNQSIRLFLLEPGKVDEPVRGRLEFVNIDDAGFYEALSYVWGEPGPSGIAEYTVLLREGDSESSLELTRNLHGALKQLRLPDRARRVWVDQICINQEDQVERSKQVVFMGIIFKNASHVLVWLGLDEEKLAKSAFQFIHKLDRRFKDTEEHKKLHIAYTKDIKKQSEDEWRALSHLTDLPWFKRGWIVQEIGTEAPATMFWGQSEIDWMVLHSVCEKMTDYHHLRSQLNVRTSDIKYVFQRFIEPNPESYHENRFNFIYELHRARNLHLTDQRDRIFAWLGHYSIRTPNRQLAALEADYKKPVTEIYIDVAKRALMGENDEKTGSALISLAAVQHMSLSSRNKPRTEVDVETKTVDENKLPTWVPDWRTFQSFILSEPVNAHRAHGTSSPKLEIVGDPPILKIHGVEIDTVVQCSRPLEAKEFHAKLMHEETELAIEHLWHGICHKDQFNLTETYPNGQEALFALMQTVSNACVQIATREGKAYRDIPRTRWLQQHATFLTNALANSDVCPKLRQLAAEAAGAHKGEDWSRAANGASKNRKFARTEKGYYVLGPKVMEEGDIVCVLFGGKMPFCLRPWQDHQYLLVGECYVHGFMDGEVMEILSRGEASEKIFEIA